MDRGAKQTLVFEFGRNWQSFVGAGIDPWRADQAKASVARLLGVSDLRGRTFLDVGCGSGLSCLAALQLGARNVLGFDADGEAVAAAHELRRQAGADPGTWQLLRGSILDRTFIASLEPADVVHAWGSLHHTGAMWQAIDNAAALVAPGGTLALAIYNRVDRRIGCSDQWWRIKRFYNRAPPALRRATELTYIAQQVLRDLLALRGPLRKLGAASSGRGMDFRHDVRDWLGGFPFEYATAGAVFQHVREKHGFELSYLHAVEGHGCNELAFRRAKA